MADAWETLLTNSSLPAGHDAWEHLSAQEGGSGGTTLIVGEVAVDVEQAVVEVDILSAVGVEVQKQDNVDVNVISVVSVDVKKEEITVETCV